MLKKKTQHLKGCEPGTLHRAQRASCFTSVHAQSHHLSTRATLLNLTFLHLSADSCRATFPQSACVSHLQPVSGIPEPTRTKENIKNEEKAEEGETSAVAGRVLSHGANIGLQEERPHGMHGIAPDSPLKPFTAISHRSFSPRQRPASSSSSGPRLELPNPTRVKLTSSHLSSAPCMKTFSVQS